MSDSPPLAPARLEEEVRAPRSPLSLPMAVQRVMLSAAFLAPLACSGDDLATDTDGTSSSADSTTEVSLNPTDPVGSASSTGDYSTDSGSDSTLGSDSGTTGNDATGYDPVGTSDHLPDLGEKGTVCDGFPPFYYIPITLADVMGAGMDWGQEGVETLCDQCPCASTDHATFDFRSLLGHVVANNIDVPLDLYKPETGDSAIYIKPSHVLENTSVTIDGVNVGTIPSQPYDCEKPVSGAGPFVIGPRGIDESVTVELDGIFGLRSYNSSIFEVAVPEDTIAFYFVYLVCREEFLPQ